MMATSLLLLITTLLGGYLLGSIPFGLVLTRMAGLGDIRTIGSGNIGATNILRTGRKDLALLTLLLDAAKGAVVVMVLTLMDVPALGILCAAAGAVLGHIFPLWLKFNGGKGVATTLGTLLAIDVSIGMSVCLTWLVVALLSRYSSLAAIVAISLSGPYAVLMGRDMDVTILCVFFAYLIILRHRANIARLLRGEESKIAN